MASPLSTLRKYQFAFFVVFGVVLMIVFVIDDPLNRWLSSRSGQGQTNKTVVASWRGGSITEQELGYEQGLRNVVGQFLAALNEETTRRKGFPRVQRLGLSISEQEIVYTRVLASKAEEMGLVATDESVLHYLEKLGGDLIPTSEIGAIFRESVGDRITEQQMLHVIRTELLAQNLVAMTNPDLTRGQLPAEAWKYYQRLFRRVKAEVVPLNVADFKSQVTKQPSESEIAQLYEQAKNQYPDPLSPEPGFKRRRKAAFDFVRADQKKFEDEEVAKIRGTITDAEITEYYDKNMEEFRVVETTTDSAKPSAEAPETEKPGSTEKPANDTSKGEGSPPGDATDKSAKPDDNPTESPAPKDKPAEKNDAAKPAEAKPAEAKPAEAKPAEAKPAEAKPAEAKPAEAKSAEEKPPVDKPAPEKGGSESDKKDESAPPGCGELELAAQQEQEKESEKPADSPAKPADQPASQEKPQDKPAAEPVSEPADKPQDPPAKEPANKEADQKPANEKPANEKPADAKPADEKPADEKPADEKPADKKPADEKPADKKPADKAPASSTTTADDKPTDKPAETPAAPEKPAVKYKPLDDKLREEIRDKLARQKASQAAQSRVDAAFSEIKRVVEKYARQMKTAELSKGEKPSPMDIEALAKSKGIEAGHIPLCDPLQVREYELGKTFNFDFSGMQFQRIPFEALAYQDGLPLYKPEVIRGENFDVHFLYWKVQDEEPFVPELKDIRDEVVEAWKMREAVLVAQSEAKSLAEKASAEKKSLAEVFAGHEKHKVAQTNEFTWMTTGFVPAGMGMPTLSSVDNVPEAGQEFMRAVFALDVGETGVAINQPHTTVYVVRVESESPSEDTLRDMFLQTGASMELQSVAMMDRQELRRTWLQSIEQEMNLQWTRDPQS